MTPPYAQTQSISAITPLDRILTPTVDKTLTCEIGELTHKVHVIWEDVDNEEITNGTDGYIVNQGTVDYDHVQRSTLTITSARLKEVVDHKGRYTTWKCKVRSIQFPLSNVFGKDLTVEFPIYGRID